MSRSSAPHHSLRLMPGEDLKTSIQRVVTDEAIHAGCIVTCVGSLTVARLRLAGATTYKTAQGPFEIVSLVGTLGVGGCHLHISLSDDQGHLLGGHLVSGCTVHTTAEIVIGVIPDLRFERTFDSATGYSELEVIEE